MNLKRFVYIIAMLITFNAVSFGETKSFTKEATEVVPAHQSQDQVIAYVTQKLTREATEEAGVFIQSTLEVKNGKIEKDEITNIAGSISEIIIEEKEPLVKDNQTYVKVKVKIKVDTESVKAFLEKIKKDNKYKQELEELNKKNLELEEKLKTATKQEYELKLSVQAQEQVEQQKQRAIELNKMALKAKEDYVKAENEQKQKELQRQEEFNALKKKMEQEQLDMQNKIAQEKDEIRKAELENQAKIKELENKAKENMAGWDTTNKITIQQVLEEAKRIKKETSETITKFETLLVTNKEQLTKSYDTQIEILKSEKFSQENPAKDQWESKEHFNTRLQEYKIQKQAFFDILDQRVAGLKEIKKEALEEDEKETLQSMVTTTAPFIEKLNEFQKESFYDKDRKKAELLLLETNVDKEYFSIELKYNNKKHKIKFDFSDIGLEKGKLIYQTQNQLVIEPLFSVEENNGISPVITAFNIKHLGTELEKNIYLYDNLKEFSEISKFKDYEKKLKSIESSIALRKEDLIVSISAGKFHTVGLKRNGTVVATRPIGGYNDWGQCDVQNWQDILAISAGYDHTVGLNKYGNVVAVGGANEAKGALQQNQNEYYGQCNVQGWQDIIEISAGFKRTVGLKKNGTVVAVGYNNYGQCDVSNWRNIVAISAGENHTVGLKRNGTVVAVGLGNRDVSNWKNIVAISAGENHTVGLKKDGTVVAVGKNMYGQCKVQDWKDIVAISAGENHTVGLKKDGTVVAVGYNKSGQCNVQGWQNITAISAGAYHTVALKKNEKVIAVGSNGFEQCNVAGFSRASFKFNYTLAI